MGTFLFFILCLSVGWIQPRQECLGPFLIRSRLFTKVHVVESYRDAMQQLTLKLVTIGNEEKDGVSRLTLWQRLEGIVLTCGVDTLGTIHEMTQALLCGCCSGTKSLYKGHVRAEVSNSIYKSAYRILILKV